MLSNKTVLAGLAALMVAVGAAPAEPRHGRIESQAARGGFANESMSAMDRMQAEMQRQRMTGDPEVDLHLMMIPHHRGAIAMSEAYLRHGRDPHTRKMARKMIRMQVKEVEEMQDWLARRGYRVARAAR